MKNIILIFGILFLSLNLSAQRYTAKNGYVGFFSHTPIEDIKAGNNQVASIIDASTGDGVFQILIKSFHFDKTLMEEHFNENYMETELFPRSVFKGKITNISEVNFSKAGVYNVAAEGEMMIHGVSKSITTSGTLEIIDDGIIARSKFFIKPEDYGIKIPGLVRDNIAKEIEVTVNIKYTVLSN